MMERYKDIDGDSNVIAYEIGDGCITVEFGDGSIYLYSDQSAGAENIREMQRLGRSGEGLNRFISKYIRKKYSKKIR